MGYKLRCPVCRQTFPFDPSMEQYPEQCRLKACQAYIGSGRDMTDVVMPFIRSSDKTKRTDQVYRDIEKSSEVRAEMAAEAAGVPVSEMSALKITNLQDAKHQGDVAMAPVNNSVTQFMEQNKVGGFQGVDASTFAAGVKSGPLPNAGARAMQKTQKALRGF